MPRLHLPIQDPCHENWDAMNREGEARRFCEVCTKHVHDLSALTEGEARAVLAEESAKGRVCVRYRADQDGNIKFRQETVSAPTPGFWRMTMAAAGLGLALLTGCTDSQPDEVLEDRCVYELGPWSFSAQRGQGTCPAVEEEPEMPMVMGAIPIEDPPPEPTTHEVKGDVGPVPEAVMGEAPMVEPDPVPKPEVMGKIAPVEQPEPAEIELMGDVDVDAVEPAEKAPCDPAAERGGPRRI
jgi:hypothetical protein